MKMSIFCKLIYKFNIIPTKTQKQFFELGKFIIKFIWQEKKAKKSGKPERGRQKAEWREGGPPDGHTHVKPLTLQGAVGTWMGIEDKEPRRRSGDRHNRVYKFSCNKFRPATELGEDGHFNKWCSKNWTAIWENIKLGITLTLYAMTSKDFRCEEKKWNNTNLRKVTAESLCNLNMQKAFLIIIQNPGAIKKKTGESDHLEISTISNVKI